jgi:hypothetical protein
MKNIQEKIKLFCQKNDLNSPIEHRLLDTISDIGRSCKRGFKQDLRMIKKPYFSCLK